MRMILPFVALAALAACASEDTASNDNAEVAENAVETGVDADMTAAGMTFEIADEPGVDRTEFGTDGTFTDYYQGKLRRTGTFTEPGNGELCFTTWAEKMRCQKKSPSAGRPKASPMKKAGPRPCANLTA